jgi:hypothetical protein
VAGLRALPPPLRWQVSEPRTKIFCAFLPDPELRGSFEKQFICLLSGNSFQHGIIMIILLYNIYVILSICWELNMCQALCSVLTWIHLILLTTL